MEWSNEELASFEDIASKLAAEAHVATAGSDDGLVPLFSLVSDLTESFPQDAELSGGALRLLKQLEPMLETASPFSEAGVAAVREYVKWCHQHLADLQGLGVQAKQSEANDCIGPLPDKPAMPLEVECSTSSSPTSDTRSLETVVHRAPSELLDAIDLNEFSRIAQQFAAELLLATPGSEEGMLPVYSLLKEFESSFVTQERIQDAINPAVRKMDRLLDSTAAFDQIALDVLTQLNIWLEAAHTAFARGEVPHSCEYELSAIEDPHANQSRNQQSEGAGEPFAEFDVVMDLDLEENRELLGEFHAEALDHLGQIETAVLELERNHGDQEAIDSMFRSFHTLKGVAGFLNLVPINRLSHEIESLMDLIRNGKLEIFTEVIDLVLEAKDTVGQLLEQISLALAHGSLPSQAIAVSQLMTRARWAMGGQSFYLEQLGGGTPEEESSEGLSRGDADGTSIDVPAATGGKPLATRAAAIRVNISKLDNLMDMVGELVIVQSQLQECSKSQAGGNPTFQRNLSQLARITKELQHNSMSLRMIPIRPTFQKMDRIVRDLAAKSGKKVRFEVEGEETELDRNVVEEIGDPLIHMVRNALDHGIEPPEDRDAAQKEDVGFLGLKAYHRGSNIVVEIADDGRGIHPDKVRAKAIANGIIRPDESLSREEIFKLIFAPGFSTAETITDISGRGVGMDVVKQNIEKLRGKIEIESELGRGSVFKIVLPLTMAIVDGLVVTVGKDRFILPTTSVKVALRPDRKVLARIQGNVEVLNIRDKVVPLLRLHERFQIADAITNPLEGTVVVVETGGKPCGLLVDDMVSKQEVVIKSLGSMMRRVPGISGGAILGDGTIALILDPAALVATN